MIKIKRISKPDELTEQVRKDLTEEFKADNKKAVWNKPYIRKRLLEMSHGKCCYCECYVGPGKKEMHIDHFKPKKLYPDLVVEWDNLLPSCPHCNKNKSDHDTLKEPIINPSIDDPKEYLYLKLYRYRSKEPGIDSIGKRTIDILNLNDSDENVIERYKIGEEIQKKLQETYDDAQELGEQLKSSIRKRNRVVATCRDILKKGLETAEYSAFMATIIHDDSNYIRLKELLEKYGIWSEELQKLHTESLANKYDTE